MTLQTIDWIPYGGDGAALNAACKALSDAFTAVGLPKTGDTGQIDLTTGSITPPATAATSTITPVGYEIRRMQATGKPTIYLKVTYGVIVGTANTLSTYLAVMTVSAGIGTDGAGNLSSASILLLGVSATYVTTSVSRTLQRRFWMASDGANYLSFINDPTLAAGGSYAYMSFGAERTITATSGDYNSEGMVSVKNSTSNDVYNVFSFSATATYSAQTVPFQFPSTLFSSSGSGDAITLFPLTVCTPSPQGPASSMIGVYVADVANGVEFSTTNVYGGTKNFKQAGLMYSSPIFGAGASGRPCYRID